MAQKKAAVAANLSNMNTTFKKSDIGLGGKKESIINDRDAKMNQRE